MVSAKNVAHKEQSIMNRMILSRLQIYDEVYKLLAVYSMEGDESSEGEEFHKISN